MRATAQMRLLLALVAAAAATTLVTRAFGPDDALLRITIVCGMHARERFAYDMCARWVARLADTAVERVRILVVPDANPGGRAVWESNASMACWRGNARGVDLNRNWPVPGVCTTDAAIDDALVRESPLSPGAAPGSEWETRALAAILSAEAPDVLIALHSGTRALLTPYDACDVTPANYGRLMQLGRWLRQGVCDDCVLAPSPRVLYRSRGTLTDWAYHELGVPFVYTWEVYEAPDDDGAAADCARAFSPPAHTMAYHDALAAWDDVPARLGAMDGATWETLLRWLGAIE